MPLHENASVRTGAACRTCPVHSCLARRGGGASTSAWTRILAPRIAVMPGAVPLFRVGTELESIYSVRGGCIKTWVVGSDGKERIHAFYLPGDIIGLDAFSSGRYSSTATAVVPSQVCTAPAARLQRVLQREPELCLRIVEQASDQLALAFAIAGDLSAEQRVAMFLLQMDMRLGARTGAFKLPMTRRDIGNHLGLTVETVSRTFTQFERQRLVRCEDRQVQLPDADRLRALVETVERLLPTGSDRFAN